MKKMNKKGFTLIELLAVLLVLAIIALIAIPIVTQLIKNSRLRASERAAEGLFDAVDVYYDRRIIYDNGVFNNNNDLYIAFGTSFDSSEDGLVNGDTAVEYSGYKITSGKIMVDRNGVITIVEPLVINTHYCIKNAKGNAVCTEEKPEGY